MGNQLIKSSPSSSSSSSSSTTCSVLRSQLSSTVVVGLVDQSPPLVATPNTLKPRSYLLTVTTTAALVDAALMGTGNAKGSRLIPAASPSSSSSPSSPSSSSSPSSPSSPSSSSAPSSSPAPADTPEQVVLIKMSRLNTYFLDLSHLNLRELCGKSMSQAHNLRGLQLGFNKLTSLPVEMGSLGSLCFLDLSSNLLTSLPESLSSLHFLIELKLARNRLTALPDSLFSSLTKLESLDLSHNQFESVSSKVANLTSLVTLHLDGNPLAAVPFELGKLKFLRTVTLEGCPLLEDLPENLRAIVESAAATNAPAASATSASAATSSAVTAVTAEAAPQPPKGPSTFPSLKELAARVLVRHSVPVAPESIPHEVVEYLNTAQTCSFCQGPYFEYHVKRYRFAVRGGTTFPMESRLCSAHWHTEKERILALFRPIPSTSPKKLDEHKLQLIASRQARPVATRRSSSVSIVSLDLTSRRSKKTNWVARATSRKLKGKGLAANTSNLGASADNSHAPSTPTLNSPSSASLTASTSNGANFIRRRKASSSDVMSSPEATHSGHKMETENEQIKSMKASTSSLF